MHLDLPALQTDRLPHSPLALSVCQIRYEHPPAVSDARNILLVHQVLGGRDGKYPIVEPFDLTTLTIPLGSALPQPHMSPPQKGWRMRSEDGRWVVSLTPDHVALETTRYTTWDDFRPRLAALLDAVAEYRKPTIEQRTGLRYVNRITEPRVETPQERRAYIAPELLGPVLHQRFGGAVVAAQQQLDLDAGKSMRCRRIRSLLMGRGRDGD